MTKRNFIQSHKGLFIVGMVILVIALAVAGRLIYEQSVVNNMRQIANQFQAPSDWELTSESYVEPSLFCVGDEPCPYYVKSWDIRGGITELSIDRLMKNAEWTTVGTASCYKLMDSSYLYMCSKTATNDQYTVQLFYDTSSTKDGIGHLNIRLTDKV